MSDIVERLRNSASPSDLTREAADRMEKIEFSLTRERNDAQTAAQRATKHAARLLAALEQITFRSSDKVAVAIARAVLDQSSLPEDTAKSVAAEARYFEDHADRFAEAHKGIARAALDQSSPPKASP